LVGVQASGFFEGGYPLGGLCFFRRLLPLFLPTFGWGNEATHANAVYCLCVPPSGADYALLGVVEGFASALRIEVGEEVATFDVATDMLEIAISVVVVLVDVVLFVAVEKGQHLVDGGGFFEFADFHNISFWVFR